MKKVININFQGRVIPIEETAFDLLKQYIDSLRSYFAREEGRDEIINDIESRIAELFSERLKKGAVCITDQDVNEVSASIGRPEDFEDDGGSTTQETTGEESKQSQQQQSTQSAGSQQYATGRGRLYRNTDDKILGGVCSGLANYLGIDPVILRIIFVILMAPLFWVYIILWIVVPGKSVQTNITKRLYRSSDDKVIAGVAGGLAAYFHIDTWIPRLIFALPLILALVSGPFDFFWNDWGFWGPKFITGSLGWTLFITYVILWIAVPVAVTASEKLEAKGERVDINSIADTVKEDLKGFQQKAEKWGQEVKQSAQQFGSKAQEFGKEAGEQFKTYTGEASSRVQGSGLGHAIGVIFKALFMLIAGGIAVALFIAVMWVLFGGFNIFPLKAFILEGFKQEVLAWLSLILFLGIPIVAVLTWLIRNIAGVKKNKYIGFAFGTLWTIGLICVIVLSGLIARNFRSHEKVYEDARTLTNTNGRLLVDIKQDKRLYSSDWFGFDADEDWPFYAVSPDTLLISMVRVKVVKSPDSTYHAKLVKMSRGRTPEVARNLAGQINFTPVVENNTLYLPEGFLISRDEKWRSQGVLLILEVPVGKRVTLDRSLDRYEHFDIQVNRRDRYDSDLDREWHWLEYGKEYVMTKDDGPRKVEDMSEGELKKGNFKLKIKDGDTEINAEINTNDSNQKEDHNPNNDYRYKGREERKEKTDSTAKKVAI
ncbi:PspC domain-containing protein [Pseudobacter ginsenosidimutans]|uniref:Phage shock protein C (PspC) family protein n=1 Tax=Pseudobacter ginsenosidimutans TaxID=661488 RepID=A0A4Q7MX58_9BACT|nr:PspC domain-containing protein [Pseudobacter ginsenosidimutans]QEC41444.1 PspC domain-containing protein [Pseudobacter ginsenosidimutans]RZS71773.1 phage shock protein C (PspC) family protein [Pseudobacter ginsenosidimutans]